MDDLFSKKIKGIKKNNRVKFNDSSTKNSTIKENSPFNSSRINKKKKFILNPNLQNNSKNNLSYSRKFQSSKNLTEISKDSIKLPKSLKNSFYSAKQDNLNDNEEEDQFFKKSNFLYLKKKNKNITTKDILNEMEKQGVNYVKKKLDYLSPLPSYKNDGDNKNFNEILHLTIMQRRKQYNEKLKKMKVFENYDEQIKLIQEKWRLYFKNNVLIYILKIQNLYRKYKEKKQIKQKMITITSSQLKPFIDGLKFNSWKINYLFFIEKLMLIKMNQIFPSLISKFKIKSWKKNYKFFIEKLKVIKYNEELSSLINIIQKKIRKNCNLFIEKLKLIKKFRVISYLFNLIKKNINEKYKKLIEQLKLIKYNKGIKLLINTIKKSINKNNKKFFGKLKLIKKYNEIGIQVEILKDDMKFNPSICIKTFPRPFHEIGNNIKVLKTKIINRETTLTDMSISSNLQMKYEGNTGRLISIKPMNLKNSHNKIKFSHLKSLSIQFHSSINESRNFSFLKKQKRNQTKTNILNNNKAVKIVKKKVIFNKWFYFSKIGNYIEIQKLCFIQKQIKKYLKKLQAKRLSQLKRIFHIKLFIILLSSNTTIKIRKDIIHILKKKYNTNIKNNPKKIPKKVIYTEIRKGIIKNNFTSNFSNFQKSNKLNSKKEQSSSTTIINDETIYRCEKKN